MRQPARLVSDRERIGTLERRADGVDLALAPMKTQLQEIHDLLFGANAILWFLTKLSAVVGGAAAFVVAGITIWKFFAGH